MVEQAPVQATVRSRSAHAFGDGNIVAAHMCFPNDVQHIPWMDHERIDGGRPFRGGMLRRDHSGHERDETRHTIRIHVTGTCLYGGSGQAAFRCCWGQPTHLLSKSRDWGQEERREPWPGLRGDVCRMPGPPGAKQSIRHPACLEYRCNLHAPSAHLAIRLKCRLGSRLS